MQFYSVEYIFKGVHCCVKDICIFNFNENARLLLYKLWPFTITSTMHVSSSYPSQHLTLSLVLILVSNA